MSDTMEIGGFLWPADDRWCSRVIFDELADLNLALPHCRGQQLAVQAGGNVGVWAARLAQEFETVWTFEPCKANHDCLRKNVPKNVRHRLAALGDVKRSAGLVEVAGNAGAHYLSQEPGPIRVIRLDDLELPACDLLVLDVEGCEPHALHGAVQMIRRFRPVIMMEEKGLSERYYGIRRGAAERWLVREHRYRIAARVRADVILVPELP